MGLFRSSEADRAFRDMQQARAAKVSNRNAAATAGSDQGYRKYRAAAERHAQAEQELDRRGRGKGWW